MVNSTDLVLEFLEACVHQILYSKGVYPESVFEKRIKYGHQVFQSRHPDINSYIRQVLGNAHPLVDAGLVESVVVVLNRDLGGDGNRTVPVENIAISCAIAKRISTTLEGDKGDAMVTEEDPDNVVSDQILFDLERDMKNALIELMKMPKLPEENTHSWAIQVHTSKSSVGVDPQQDAVLRESLRSKEWKVNESEQAIPFSNNSMDDPRGLRGISSFSNSIFSANMTRTTFS